MSTRDPYAGLQAMADFDHVFTVSEDGQLTHGPTSVYAPEVYHSEESDITDTGPWEALTGYTSQWGYNGPVMHSSEYLGGRIASDILDTPGVYVVTVVEVMPEDVCRHCERPIEEAPDGTWFDPAAPATPEDGDDYVWRDYCDSNDTERGAPHEPDSDPAPAGWVVLRLRDGQ